MRTYVAFSSKEVRPPPLIVGDTCSECGRIIIDVLRTKPAEESHASMSRQWD